MEAARSSAEYRLPQLTALSVIVSLALVLIVAAAHTFRSAVSRWICGSEQFGALQQVVAATLTVDRSGITLERSDGDSDKTIKLPSAGRWRDRMRGYDWDSLEAALGQAWPEGKPPKRVLEQACGWIMMCAPRRTRVRCHVALACALNSATHSRPVPRRQRPIAAHFEDYPAEDLESLANILRHEGRRQGCDATKLEVRHIRLIRRLHRSARPALVPCRPAPRQALTADSLCAAAGRAASL